MKIINIFAYKLFAFQYDGEASNEYDRLLNLWNDAEYIYSFLKENMEDIPKQKTISQLAELIMDDAIELDEALVEITESENEILSHFFRPLNNREFQLKILSLQKGRQHCLRLYAIKIDEDVFVITGGAIKLPLQHMMQDRKHTNIELQKIKNAQDYLKEQDIFNEDSFFEFLKEN